MSSLIFWIPKYLFAFGVPLHSDSDKKSENKKDGGLKAYETLLKFVGMKFYDSLRDIPARSVRSISL